MNAKMDRRSLRTREILREALFDMASNKPLENITVKELTDRARLNRGTFYVQYQDMNDFLEQLKNEILEEYHSIIKKLGYHNGGREPFVDPPVGFVRPFEFVQLHERFFRIFMGSVDSTGFAKQMSDPIKNQFQSTYLMKHRHLKPIDIPVKQLYLFSYLASAYIGSLQLWIQRDFDLSPNEMAILFSNISRLGSAGLEFKD
ncbi:TetR/AcrR family transcriptional regulator [Paenibacillus xylanexedens]|uniref:TetR/AcrR family transcriptional regulator n=1 Tax=Paenibacillus xylanexedens TaxID=528191 RepID=UPI0011A9A9C0|nr:TetR/AcrR family transcriptional regulator C-terminal domain-containing protein [Paenibacillus xylanexedens]